MPQSLTLQFQEYLELCEAQEISLGVIYDKKRLLKLFRSYKILSLEHISQDFINKIVRAHLPSMANKLVKNLKSFLNFCIKRQYYERSRYESFTFLMSKDKVRETVISQRAYDTCLHGCSYCYATCNSRQTQKNARLHDAHSPLIIGNLADHDRLIQKTLRPLLTTPKDAALF